jgi:putative peptidoglycan lipid II flippase
LPWGAILNFAKDRPHSAAIGTAVAMATPLVVATLVTSSSAIIDQGMAGTLPSGSVGALAYASRIVLFAAIPLVAISTAVFPAVAEQIVGGDTALVRRQVAHRARQILLAGVVLVPVVVICGRSVVERIITSNSDTSVHTVAETLSVYALMLPAFGVSFLLLRVLTALGRSRWVMWIAVASAGANFVGDLLLKGSFGLEGIAACTVIVQTSMCVALAFAVKVGLDPAGSGGAQDHVET